MAATSLRSIPKSCEERRTLAAAAIHVIITAAVITRVTCHLPYRCDADRIAARAATVCRGLSGNAAEVAQRNVLFHLTRVSESSTCAASRHGLSSSVSLQ